MRYIIIPLAIIYYLYATYIAIKDYKKYRQSINKKYFKHSDTAIIWFIVTSVGICLFSFKYW